ncbi:7TM diverse intracellular signaling domain-containing protein [Leptospira ognonensis]|nr:GAF domain-containing protein [Leptospira ognonensis]
MSCHNDANKAKPPIVEAGAIDLTSWDFAKNSLVSLDGDWEFYWSEFIEPCSQNEKKVSLASCKEKHIPKFQRIPSEWQDLGYDSFGYGSYRLRLKLPACHPELAFDTISPGTASKLFVDGKVVSQKGQLGSEEASHMPFWTREEIPLEKFMPSSECASQQEQTPDRLSVEHEIVFHISNYFLYRAGLWSPLILRTRSALASENKNRYTLDIFIFAGLLVMGLYNLGVYFNRRKDRSALFYGCLSLLFGLRSICIYDRNILNFLPSLPFLLMHRYEIFAFYFGIALFLLFVKSLYEEEFNALLTRVLLYFVFFASAIALTCPPRIYFAILPFVQLTTVVAILLVIYSLAKAAFNKRLGARLFLLGFFLFALTVVNDMLVASGIYYFPSLANVGFFLLIFVQAEILSRRFAIGFTEAEKLTENLSLMSANLEQMVADKTKEVEELNEFALLINSKKDLEEIFQEITRYLYTKYRLVGSWLFLPTENQELLVASKAFSFSNLSKDRADFLMKMEIPISDAGGFLAKTFLRRKPIYIKRFPKFAFEIDQLMATKIGFKSFLSIPLVRNESSIGIFAFTNFQLPMNLKPRDIQNINSLCSQIAGAIDTTHLLEQVEASKHKLESQHSESDSLNQLFRSLNENLELKNITEKILTYIRANFEIQHIAIMRFNRDKTVATIAEAIFPEAKELEKILRFQIPLQETQGAHSFVLKFKRYFYTTDAERKGMLSRATEEEQYIIKCYRIKTFLIIPLILNNEMIGTIDLSNSDQRMQLTKKDIEKLTVLGEQLSGIIYGSLLFGEVQKSKLQADLAKINAESQKRDLERLNELIKSLNENLNLKLIMKKVHTYIRENFKIEYYGLGIVDEKQDRVTSVDTHAPDFLSSEDRLKVNHFSTSIHDPAGAHAFAFRSKKPLFSKKVNKSYISNDEREMAELCKFDSVVILPLILQNEPIGFLDLYNVGKISLTREDITKLSILSEHLAGIIYETNLLSQLQIEKDIAIASHQETERVLLNLKTSQDQLVQSEKMAALGQLVAGIAHEINTPIGAIKATATNLKDSLVDFLDYAPGLIKSLDNDVIDLAEELIVKSAKDDSLSVKEERKIRNSLTSLLESENISHADDIADLLVGLGEKEINPKFTPLWIHENTPEIIKFIQDLSGLKSKSDNIGKAVEKTVKIIYALKNYTKKDDSGIMQKADLHEGIETVLTIYHNNLKQGVEVIREFQEIPSVLCFASDLNQLWTNLVFNAIQAMNGKGRLLIRTCLGENEMVEVSFEDSGVGIPSEVLPKIYEAFYTTKPEGEGSGMGLFICKQIVDKHNGKIGVESEPGRTRFTVSLPIRGIEK